MKSSTGKIALLVLSVGAGYLMMLATMIIIDRYEIDSLRGGGMGHGGFLIWWPLFTCAVYFAAKRALHGKWLAK